MNKTICIKTFATALALLICIVYVVPAQAVAAESGVQVVPSVVTACPYGNGIHDMDQRGTGTVYIGSWPSATTLFHGLSCFQWQKCYEVIICEDSPKYPYNWIGRYATMAYYDPISGFGFDIFTTLNAIGYVNGNRLPGYAFR